VAWHVAQLLSEAGATVVYSVRSVQRKTSLAKLLPEAEKLVCTALSGNPPDDIADELRDLLEQIYFERHLALRGIELQPDEIQMSIAGKEVGYGIASTEAFLQRVENTENLLYRTAERKHKRPYRDRGRRDKSLTESLQLYITVPRGLTLACAAPPSAALAPPSRLPRWIGSAWRRPKATRSGDRADLAQIGAVRCRSADRIERRAADDQVEIGAVRSERIVAWRPDLCAGLPPAVLADHHTGVEIAVEPGAGAHTALRRRDRHPVAIGDTAYLRCLGMQFHFRMRGALAQAG